MDVNILFPEINSFKSKPSATYISRSKRRRNRKKEKLIALKRRVEEEAKQPLDAPPPPSIRQDTDQEDAKQPSNMSLLDAEEEDVNQPSDALLPPSLGIDTDEEDVIASSLDRPLRVGDDETRKAMVFPASTVFNSDVHSGSGFLCRYNLRPRHH